MVRGMGFAIFPANQQPDVMPVIQNPILPRSFIPN
jgi:hypothetical protein